MSVIIWVSMAMRWPLHEYGRKKFSKSRLRMMTVHLEGTWVKG